MTKKAEARRAKKKSVTVDCTVSCNWFGFTFCFQSKSLEAIGLDPCVHSRMINKILDRNHFNVLLIPSLCVLRLSLLRRTTGSIYLRMDIRTWNFNLIAVGKNLFLSSIWQGRYKMWLSELKPVLKKPPAYTE